MKLFHLKNPIMIWTSKLHPVLEVVERVDLLGVCVWWKTYLIHVVDDGRWNSFDETPKNKIGKLCVVQNKRGMLKWNWRWNERPTVKPGHDELCRIGSLPWHWQLGPGNSLNRMVPIDADFRPNHTPQVRSNWARLLLMWVLETC